MVLQQDAFASSAMNEADILKKLKKIIDKNLLKIQFSNMDSLNKIKVLINLEKNFKIKFQPKEISKLFNGDIKKMVKIIKFPYYLSHFIKKIHFSMLTFFSES